MDDGVDRRSRVGRDLHVVDRSQPIDVRRLQPTLLRERRRRERQDRSQRADDSMPINASNDALLPGRSVSGHSIAIRQAPAVRSEGAASRAGSAAAATHGHCADAADADSTLSRRHGSPTGATVGGNAQRGGHDVLSAAFFLVAAAVTSAWVPDAFTSAVLGMAVGCVLGVVGLWVSRWEATPGTLHYTPNRWLVLAITLVVTARVLYGFWRGWTSMRSGADETSFLTAFGVAGSLAAGATVLGYYLAYGIGVRRRISTWQKRSLRVIKS